MNAPLQRLLGIMFAATLGACGALQPPAATPLPPGFAALPDTLVCVVDRTVPLGLRNIAAKVDGMGVVLHYEGQVVPLESVHPVNVIAGYAGRERWLATGEPLHADGHRFQLAGGERRIGLDLLRRVGEHESILLFAGASDDSPADALYVPTAPGCIFQPYVRDDLIRR